MRWQVFFSWAVLASLGLGLRPSSAGEVKAGKVWRLGFASATEEHRSVEWIPVRIARVSATRFLGLFVRSEVRLDPWRDQGALARERREKGFVASSPIKSSRDLMVLAFLGPTGKVVKQSHVSPEAEALISGFSKTEDAALLVIEHAACPYGVLRPARQELLCFDWELNFQKKLAVPMDMVTGAVPVTGGAGAEVWVFGQLLRGKGDSPELPAAPWKRWGLVEGSGEPSALRLLLTTGEVKPLAGSEAALGRELRRAARLSSGDKVAAPLEGLAFLLPQRPLGPPPVGMVVTALARRPGGGKATVERVFFQTRADEQGWGSVRQLPFWVLHEEEAEPRLDGEKGLAVMPQSAAPMDLQAIALDEATVGILCSFVHHEGAEDVEKGQQREGHAWVFLAVIGKEGVELLDFSRVKNAIKSLSSSDLKITPFPVYLGQVSRQELLFAALCREEDRAERCAASVVLGM